MSELLSVQDACDRLRIAVQEAGSQKAFAEKHGLSPQYVNDVFTGRRDPSGKILTALGLVRVVQFRAVQP